MQITFSLLKLCLAAHVKTIALPSTKHDTTVFFDFE